MQICIHRGSNQIGGSCVELESCGQRLLIDFGLPLDAESNTTQYLPDITGLNGDDPSLLGIMITHPHLDHFGLLAHISPKIPWVWEPLPAGFLQQQHPSFRVTGRYLHRVGTLNQDTGSKSVHL